ncbi:MAG: hypothetical protein AB8B81_21010 [Halioglobus sp.]
MEIAVIVILLALVVGVFLKTRGGPKQPAKPVSKSKSKKSSTNSEALSSASKSYKAVTIGPGPNACEAVLSFDGKRFLSGDAPILPLTDCGSSTCTCKYVHHEDRRDTSEDRRQPFSMRTDLHGSGGEEERRQRAGRRGPDKI